jgi:hypothetical protein
MQQMVIATKRARMARAMVTAMRVPVDKEVKGGTGQGIGDKGAVQRRGQWGRRQEQWQRGWRASNGNEGNGNGEGKQQSTSDGIDKGGRWLARERRRGDHTTTMVGNNERQERAAVDDGSDKEGKGGKGHGDDNEGGSQQRGQGRQ